jgi:hypothetical protein
MFTKRKIVDSAKQKRKRCSFLLCGVFVIIISFLNNKKRKNITKRKNLVFFISREEEKRKSFYAYFIFLKDVFKKKIVYL